MRRDKHRPGIAGQWQGRRHRDHTIAANPRSPPTAATSPSPPRRRTSVKRMTTASKTCSSGTSIRTARSSSRRAAGNHGAPGHGELPRTPRSPPTAATSPSTPTRAISARPTTAPSPTCSSATCAPGAFSASRASNGGAAANAPSQNPSISANGQFVAFDLRGSNLSPCGHLSHIKRLPVSDRSTERLGSQRAGARDSLRRWELRCSTTPRLRCRRWRLGRCRGEHSLRPSLIGRLVRNRRWFGATGLGLLGWPLEIAALLLAPLTVVQPCLASGLILLLWLGATKLGEAPGRREAVAVTAIIIGVAGVAWAAPDRSTDHAGAGAIALALGLSRSRSPLPMRCGAGRSRSGPAGDQRGLRLRVDGIASKLLTDELAAGALLVAMAWLATAAVSEGLALLSEMSALQRRPATHVAPVMFAVQVLVPVLLAPLIFGESWGYDAARRGRAGRVHRSFRRWHRLFAGSRAVAPSDTPQYRARQTRRTESSPIPLVALHSPFCSLFTSSLRRQPPATPT